MTRANRERDDIMMTGGYDMQPNTLELLETAMEGEMKKFLELINGLENAHLYDFARRVSTFLHHENSSLNDIIGVAKNIRRIEDAAENLYSV